MHFLYFHIHDEPLKLTVGAKCLTCRGNVLMSLQQCQTHWPENVSQYTSYSLAFSSLVEKVQGGVRELLISEDVTHSSTYSCTALSN